MLPFKVIIITHVYLFEKGDLKYENYQIYALVDVPLGVEPCL